MQKYSIRELVEMAVQTERLGYAFYTEVARKFENDDALQELFATLAKKERGHEKIFKSLLGNVDAREVEGPEEVASYMRALVESEFFLGSGKSLPSLGHVTTVGDAVDFALGFEKETLLYFVGLQGMVREQDVVQKIIDEERAHIAWLGSFKEKL